MNRVTDNEIFIESEAPLADTPQWSIPLRLAMAVESGETAHLGKVSPLLAGNLTNIRDIYAAWIHGHAVPLDYTTAHDLALPAKGVSMFFSGGLDSFYSLVKHRDEVDNLILIHGFDVPLADIETFALAEKQAREVAQFYGKRLIVVRTNLFWEQPSVPGGWFFYYGAALAAVAFALAPHHSKVYIASSYAYVDLCPCGSHPLLDPLWSTESLQFIHDGGETRMEKLRGLIDHPEALSRLRVCWENQANYNCGLCEKCVRTMLGLRALGIQHCAAFPDTLTPELVRRQRLTTKCVVYWRELLNGGLPPSLHSAVKSAIHSCDAELPPRSGKLKREINRWRIALMHAGKALMIPLD